MSDDGDVLTFILGKGGIGKTTTTYNVLSAFSIQERCNWLYTPGMVIPPVKEDEEATELGIDLDPTANLSRSSGIRIKKDAQGKEEPSIHEVLLNPQFGIEYAVKRSPIGYDILPATRSMNNLETELSDPSMVGRDFLLDQALRSAEGTPDYPIVKQAMKRRKRAFTDTPHNV
jgi:cellulose biosynthesis protein BcsQ